MNEQEDVLSPNHKRLLNIAMWTKYLAWIVLVIYILLTGAKIVEFQNFENYRADV
jgi:hypothetical protein